MSRNTATSILVYDPETGRSWYLDTSDLRPEALTLGQLSHGLAAINRFGGYTVRPITVAEHSLRVGRFARALTSRSCGDAFRSLPADAFAERAEAAARAALMPVVAELAGQIHDTPECITGRGDVLRPAKTDADRESEARAYAVVVDHIVSRMWDPGLSQSIAEKRGKDTRDLLASVAEIVHQADNLALYYESMLWQPVAEDWAPKVITDPMPDLLLPLVWPRPREDWAAEVRSTCAEICAAVRAL